MLLFIGSVYLVNGLGLLDRIDPKSSAPLNLFVGAALSAVTIALVIGFGDLEPEELSAAIINTIGYPLFAFTFLYVGILNYSGHDGAGLGWYCGWSTMISAGLAYANWTITGNTASALLWLVWTFVFLSFFVLMIGGLEKLQKLTGQFIILAGFTTCIIPATMMILGKWDSDASGFVAFIELGTIAYYVVGAAITALNAKKTAQKTS